MRKCPYPQTWAWCINLDRRQDRMKGMQERSAKVGLKLVRHKAVDPSAGDVVDAASVCKEWDTTVNARFDFSYTPNRRLAMSNGELGCAMSHVQLWRKVDAFPSESVNQLGNCRGGAWFCAYQVLGTTTGGPAVAGRVRSSGGDTTDIEPTPGGQRLMESEIAAT